jgi:hypothetical protein
MVLRRAPIVLALLLVGCPGTLDEGEFGDGGDPTCPDVPMFLATRCATAGCHTSMFPAGLLDLQSPNVGSRVIGVMSTCGGPLGDPNNPDKSIVIKKLTGNQCGTRMPLNLPALSSGEISCIQAWIAGGGK